MFLARSERGSARGSSERKKMAATDRRRGLFVCVCVWDPREIRYWDDLVMLLSVIRHINNQARRHLVRRAHVPYRLHYLLVCGGRITTENFSSSLLSRLTEENTN